MAESTPGGRRSRATDPTIGYGRTQAKIKRPKLNGRTNARRRSSRHSSCQRLQKPVYRGARWHYLHGVHYATTQAGGYQNHPTEGRDSHYSQRPSLRFLRQRLKERIYKRVTKTSVRGDSPSGHCSILYLLPNPLYTDLSVGVPPAGEKPWSRLLTRGCLADSVGGSTRRVI